MESLTYIRVYNMAGSVACVVALAAGLMYYKTSDTKYLRMLGLCQTFFLMEIANICARKSNARYIPTVLQSISRNLIMWVVFWYYGIVNEAFPIILVCWYLSDLVRYLFYTLRTNTVKIVRYNLFLVTYPIGFLLEMYCLKILYTVSGRLFSYIVAFVVLAYIPGFVLLFSHMLKQRRWSRRVKELNHKRKYQ